MKKQAEQEIIIYVQGDNPNIKMADINQFQRSRDRITELLLNLAAKKSDDPETVSYIKSLEIALKTLELKMEEYLLDLTGADEMALLDLSL